ncbi:hypothetical protein [Nakamurella endophytica]|uniref:Uncharacterized protein n=1 Tax=Nakamurella endophytica TaxID=1748367 RepID=A0A917SXK1_9ACTN|nr:hypothetical protein [Nakamurella endophytica]GGM01779.1 hypothetical protein GCM10011594_22300 [Nakamurella endophytica]
MSFFGNDTVVIGPPAADPPEDAPDDPDMAVSEPAEPEDAVAEPDPALPVSVAPPAELLEDALLDEALLDETLLDEPLPASELVPHEDSASSAAAPTAPSTAVLLVNITTPLW